MNCLELRRAVLADPRRLDPDVLAHAESCATCRAYVSESLGAEERLAQAMRIPVPEGLGERALRQISDTPRYSRRQALAAGLVLAVGAGSALLWRRNDPLALASIDFVVFEEAQAILEAKPADPDELLRAATAVGVRLPWALGELRYIGTCPFAGATAHHVVLKSIYGKATLLLLPGRTIASRLAAGAYGLEAAIAPALGGSVAIVADSSRGVARIEEFLNSA